MQLREFAPGSHACGALPRTLLPSFLAALLTVLCPTLLARPTLFSPVPSFAFLHECLELRKWRYQGADIGRVVGRMRKLALDPSSVDLQDGPADDE